jgi:hypothetical protein
MDELKIDIDKIGKGADSYEIAESCASPFNRCISRIINNGFNKIKEFKKDPTIDEFVKRQETIDSFERLRNILSITRTEAPYYAIARSFPNIIKAGEHINNRNADHFLKRNYDEMIKNDGNKTMIFDVIRIVCKCFERLSENEKDEVWELASITLIASIEFHRHLKKTGLFYGQDKKYHYVPEYDYLRKN